MHNESNQINIEEILSKIRVGNPSSFTIYLKEVWMDLIQRSEQKLKGITKLTFTSYYDLPGLLADRLFDVFDNNKNGFLDLMEFVNGMKILFCEDFDHNSKFIFDFYDFDKDGNITDEDIRTVLSYITLNESDNDIIGYQRRVSSQEELFGILEKCFEKRDGRQMDFSGFKHVIENINSDIYLMLLLFLFEKKPFSKVGLNNYDKQQIAKGIKSPQKVISKSPTKLIAIPSNNSLFSPYTMFMRPIRKRKTTITEEKSELNKKFLMNGSIRFNEKRYTLQQDSQLIALHPVERLVHKASNSDIEKINTIPHKQLSPNKLKSQLETIPQYIDMKLFPAFKQSSYGKKAHQNDVSETASIKSKVEQGEVENDQLNFNSDEDNDDDNDEEVIQQEGWLYKQVDSKMKRLWFKLIHKDLYYYKNDKDINHKGMHNLSGLFLQEEKPVDTENGFFYCFSVIYPKKTRLYYVDSKDSFDIWIAKLKIATGYTNLTDIYEVKNKLGNGKFGLVKLGINKKTNTQVAIKIMSKKKMTLQDLELVRTEIEILKICQHPNIIELYEVFENIDYFYIIMEYCSGGDLFGHIQVRNFRLPEHRACEIIHKMCAAVYYIHSYGIAHRDLKPENVLMTSIKEDADIRILDFGLSKIIGPDEKCTEPYGTLSYVAPEVLLEEPYGKAVDLWSLGVITYLLLSGALPFDDKTSEQEIARKAIYDNPPYKGVTWEQISSEAKMFIAKLLEKNPAKRMNIKDALEDDWIRKFSGNQVIADVRRQSKDNKKSTFEMYSSVRKTL